MSKGMFVQCNGCGYTGFLNLEGEFDDREKEMNRMLDEGWRYSSSHNEFLCPDCVRAGGSTDALYMLFTGKPKINDKLTSYVELRDRAERELWAFKELDLL